MLRCPDAASGHHARGGVGVVRVWRSSGVDDVGPVATSQPTSPGTAQLSIRLTWANASIAREI